MESIIKIAEKVQKYPGLWVIFAHKLESREQLEGVLTRSQKVQQEIESKVSKNTTFIDTVSVILNTEVGVLEKKFFKPL